MEEYRLIKKVGDGTYGIVSKAINRKTNDIVAIKKMRRKFFSWEDCINLREVQSLQNLNHPNIIKLQEVIREQDNLFCVFEYMELNMYQLMKEKDGPFPESKIRNWCRQILEALAYMHGHGYFHRDLKPENILVTKDVVKVADFGLVREVNSRPPFTDYVSTRWYRAPEVLLQATSYNAAIDMWAVGAIMAELFMRSPLFPGKNEIDELCKICSVIGTPNHQTWPEGLQLARLLKFDFPECSGIRLGDLIPRASTEAINLILALCSWDPNQRPTSTEALSHPFFQIGPYIPPIRLHLRGQLPEKNIIGHVKPNFSKSGEKDFVGRQYETLHWNHRKENAASYRSNLSKTHESISYGKLSKSNSLKNTNFGQQRYPNQSLVTTYLQSKSYRDYTGLSDNLSRRFPPDQKVRPRKYDN